MSARKEHFDNVVKTMDGIRKEVARKRTIKVIKLCHSKRQSGVNKLGRTRLQQELMDISVNPPPLCSARLKNDNLHEWVAAIKGPPDSVYSGGLFHLNLRFPKEYPQKPPTVKFVTKIYHCNVSPNGSICMDVLGKGWMPAMSVSAILLSICSLLCNCNPEDALVARIANLYLKNEEEHNRRARDLTKKYASPKMPSMDLY